MPITALALLKIEHCSPAPESGMRVESLEDAVLVHTGASFGSEPEQLIALLRSALGSALDEHDDPRGVFLLPDVAAPKARAYLDVIDEVGEGGAFAPLEEGGAFGLPDGLGALGAVLGSMLQHMPESVLEAASAAARGDLAAFGQVSDQVAAMMGHGRDDVSLASLGKLVGDGRALDLSSPAFQQILGTLEGELAKNPQAVERLREQFFGDQGGREDDDDDDEPSK